MLPWIILAVVAIPLLVLAFAAMRRTTRRSEGLAEKDEATARRTKQEFAEAERYEDQWREEREREEHNP